jgi:hypothetical protein
MVMVKELKETYQNAGSQKINPAATHLIPWSQRTERIDNSNISC